MIPGQRVLCSRLSRLTRRVMWTSRRRRLRSRPVPHHTGHRPHRGLPARPPFDSPVIHGLVRRRQLLGRPCRATERRQRHGETHEGTTFAHTHSGADGSSVRATPTRSAVSGTAAEQRVRGAMTAAPTRAWESQSEPEAFPAMGQRALSVIHDASVPSARHRPLADAECRGCVMCARRH